jgi:hypothetical protein
MSSIISLKCANCGKKFNRLKKECDRQIKKGKNKFYCSISCSSSDNNRKRKISLKTKEKLSSINLNNKNGYKGEFTCFLNKARNRNKPFNLSEEYLQSIWTGKCAISGIEIFNSKRDKNTLNSASLDRIDSSKGYIKGNVQFVAYGINLAKNTFSDSDMKVFLESIRSV